MRESLFSAVFVFSLILLISGCSTTKTVPEGDYLFVGLKEISYDNANKHTDHFITTQEEVDAALQTAPNGALFGSSFYRTPFPLGLWAWNSFSNSHTAVGKWMNKAFGQPPVLLSNVKPGLRAQVAEGVLRNNGYFHGKVDYEIVNVSNLKKKKVSYHVNCGEPFLIDTLEYVGFNEYEDSLIKATLKKQRVKPGDEFSTSGLDEERMRISQLLRDNGHYYYQPSYASYLADTINKPGMVTLKLQLADSLPTEAQKKYYIGNLTLDIRQQRNDVLSDSVKRRHLLIRYSGKTPPVRPRVIFSQMRLFPRRLYNATNHQESLANLTSLGLFSSATFKFTPRDNDSLDLQVNCILDNPYDFYVQTNYSHKLSGRTGPELIVGLTKKNAFRGGEKFDINAHGSYEWQQENGEYSKDRNCYEVGLDASVQWPRLLIPFLPKRRFRRVSPSTMVKAGFSIIHRPGYYRMHTASGEWGYSWTPSERLKHEFSPLIVTYQKRNYSSEKFDSILKANPYLKVAMHDMFIPKMRYILTYRSRSLSHNPVVWQTTLTEAGNVVNVFHTVMGKKWNEQNKTMFNNTFAQFFKIETDFSKLWKLSSTSQVVAHLNAGAMWSYGNMSIAPYVEQFYVGGANSIRAFNVRSVGPGSYKAANRTMAYVDQTGDVKIVLNLEYRRQLFGSLYGAVFLDAGNIWTMKSDVTRSGTKFEAKNLFDQTALGTGVGVRYDLDFFVLRLDWGVGIHAPYNTGKSGYYNFRKFKDSHSLHFAIGYPF